MNPQNTLLATKFNQRRTCVIWRWRAYKRTNYIFLTLESELLTCLQFNICFYTLWCGTQRHAVLCELFNTEIQRGETMCTERVKRRASGFCKSAANMFFCKSASWLCLCGLDAPPASIEGDQMNSSTGFVLLGSFSQFPNDQVK